jgi:RNA polymerase sigma-70 factor (ECF subfamily)
MVELSLVADAKFRQDLLALIPQIRAMARMQAGDPAAADDLAQDALAKAWQARADFAPGTNLKAWVFAILRNQFLSGRRRAWRVLPLAPEEAERSLVATGDPSSALELNEMRMALSALPHEQREALILVGAAGLSYEEVADICGCAVGTIKSRVSRARDTLRAAMESGQYMRDSLAPCDSTAAIMAEALRMRA